jgi:acetyl esterase/lipase
MRLLLSCLGLIPLAIGFLAIHPAHHAVAEPATSEAKGNPVQVPAGVIYEPDVTYRTVGEVQLQLDLARPARDTGDCPAVVVLNGGSWMDLGGDRKFCTPLVLQLAERGYVALAVTHRSAGVAPFPAQIHDAKAAVRWLRCRGKDYHVDPERIGVAGFSSGGHLACLLGNTTPADGLEGPDADPKVSSQVRAVVSCYAPTDLVLLRQKARAGQPSWILSQLTQNVLHKFLPEGKDVDWAVKASPITYAHGKAAPTLLIHGCEDSIVPLDQSERYARRLTERGGSVRLLRLPGTGHGFGSGVGGAAGKRSDLATVEFFEQQLIHTR